MKTQTKILIALALHLVFSRILHAEKERDQVTQMVNHILGLDDEKNKDNVSYWKPVKLEKEIYFKKNHVGVDEYTIYGSSDSFNPKEYKIQIKMNIADSSKVPFRADKQEFTALVTNSAGVAMLEAKRAKGSDKLEYPLLPPDEHIHDDSIPDKKFEVDSRFNKEKGYAAAKDSKYRANLDPELLKEVGVAGAEMAAWKISNKIPRLNRAGAKVRAVRKLGKLYVLVDVGDHVAQAYEVVEGGAEPKFHTVSADTLKNFQKAGTKAYADITSAFEETGVLRNDADLKATLEGEPHVKRDTTTPSTHSTSPSTHNSQPATTRPTAPVVDKAAEEKAKADAAERERKEKALEKLRKLKEQQ